LHDSKNYYITAKKTAYAQMKLDPALAFLNKDIKLLNEHWKNIIEKQLINLVLSRD